MAPSVPEVKITDDAHAHGLRSPHGKMYAVHTVIFCRMGAQLLIGIIINTGRKLL